MILYIGKQCSILQLLTIDPALGLLDYESLSDQALMEMLIDGMTAKDKAVFHDKNGNSKDVGEWRGIALSNDRVTEVAILYQEFSKKQFPFDLIPPLVTNFVVFDCNLHGLLDTSILLQNLSVINISFKNLHGTLNFKAIPRKMREMAISHNQFTGSCALDELPKSLKLFEASRNKFSGEISLNALPDAMDELNLRGNLLTGSITIETLPYFIRNIELDNNAFTGEFHLLTLPDDLEEISITGNNLCGTAIISEAYGKMPFDLVHNSLEKVYDTNGEKHEWEEQIVEDMYEESEDECISSDEESSDDA